MTVAWKKYQEEAASFFRSLQLEAITDATIKGVRTKHDIDVLVKAHHVGFEVTWLVECKHWKTPVSKLHVLGLRQIVADTGADRGIILCEVGFQSGAIEASKLTNVHVTSLADFGISAKNDIYAMRLRELYERTDACHDRYWAIPKYHRIEHGLRPGFGNELGYSGNHTIDFCRELLARAFRGVYPIKIENIYSYIHSTIPNQFNSVEEVVSIVEGLIEELESKLAGCEAISYQP